MFKDIFVDLLEKTNTTAYKLSIETNIPQSLISTYKSGTKSPTTVNLVKIAEYFNVSVDYLLGKEEKPVASDELTENLIIYHRNGKTVKKQFTKEQMEQLMRDIDALESTVDEDL